MQVSAVIQAVDLVAGVLAVEIAAVGLVGDCR